MVNGFECLQWGLVAGILDSQMYMSALLADAEAHGASLAVASRVVGGRVLQATTGARHKVSSKEKAIKGGQEGGNK